MSSKQKAPMPVTSPGTLVHQNISMPVSPPAMGSPARDSFQFDISPSQSDAASISAKSKRSTKTVFEDIKHEIMVNHLYQQQCSRLWVSNDSGEIEGILLRKSRGCYLSCPQELRTSQFAQACAELNIKVSYAPATWKMC